MDGSGSLREDNAERRIFHCDSLRSGFGVKYDAPKIEAFCEILLALPIVETRKWCI